MSKPFSVLVVEDEDDVRDLIVLHLRREGYEVRAEADGEKGLNAIQESSFSLAVIDWMLPGMSGIEIAQKIRKLPKENSRLPILMVTARADASDIIHGLESGADDYITKPFELSVLVARVKALLRRVEFLSQTSLKETSKVLSRGELTLHTETYEVHASGKKLSLTPSEFKLLKALMMNQGKVLSRDQLIELVQGEGVAVIDRAIDTHIFGLRKKLGSHADFVESIRGVGYRMIPLETPVGSHV
jgi:two-component system phosphate regulon response regulator PhoB